MLDKTKKKWPDKLLEALWAYRTPTQTTQHSLVFRVVAILPLVIQLQSLRVVVHEKMTNESKFSLHYVELETLDEEKTYRNKLGNVLTADVRRI